MESLRINHNTKLAVLNHLHSSQPLTQFSTTFSRFVAKFVARGMAKTVVDSFKGGRNVKYLREAWIWGFKCAQKGGALEEPPSADDIWEWWESIALPVSPPETDPDDDCVVLTNNIKEMTLDEKPVEKKKPGRPKKVKKKKAKKAKNPKLSKPLLRELIQELELVGEDDISDLKSLQEVYKEHYNSLLDDKGFVDEEKEGEFQHLQEKMTEAEEQWADKQQEKKVKKDKKKADSDDSSNESEEEPVVMENPLALPAEELGIEEPVDAGIPAPHPESIEAKKREAALAEVEAEEKKEKPKKVAKGKKEKKANKHKWKGGVKELREFLTEKNVEFDEKDRKPVLAEMYERYMDCEERKAEAEAENAPEMLKIDEAALAEVEIAKSKPVDVGNPLAKSPTDEEKVKAAKQIQHHWKKVERLGKDVSNDIELPKDDECGYEPLEYEGVSYQVDRETQDVLNMEGTKVGELENGIVIFEFEYPYDGMHAAKASAEVSDDSGDETEDMSSDEEDEENDE